MAEATAELLADARAPWRDKAACKGLGALFDSIGDADQKQAMGICAACPVRVACGAWVMSRTEQGDPGGVCGGWTEIARAKARRKQAARAAAVPGGRT